MEPSGAVGRGLRMDLRAGSDHTGEIPVAGGPLIDPLLHMTSRRPAPALAPTPVEVTTRLSFEDFYRAERREVGRALAVTFNDDELAAEAVDEAMTRAYARWAKVAAFDNPGGWVYRVGLNWGISVLRRRKRHKLHEHRPLAAAPATATEPAIAAAVGALDPEQRAVVVCRLLLGWSEQQTADALRIRPGT